MIQEPWDASMEGGRGMGGGFESKQEAKSERHHVDEMVR